MQGPLKDIHGGRGLNEVSVFFEKFRIQPLFMDPDHAVGVRILQCFNPCW